MTQKSDTARLDIIMPVYNTADYLDQCLQSIADQTLTDWHLIIVDDGSTDGSLQICDRWAEKDSRITVVHKENTGQADSRNIALDMCRAPYVGFADSDDWLEPDMFEFLVGNSMMPTSPCAGIIWNTWGAAYARIQTRGWS